MNTESRPMASQECVAVLQDHIADLRRLLASHKDYTQSQARGWPDNPAGYPNHEWSVEIEEKAVAAIDALQRQGEVVAWQWHDRSGQFISAADKAKRIAGGDGFARSYTHPLVYALPPQPPTGEQK